MLSAREQAAAIRRREVSAVETMQRHLDAIEAHEPQLGAIVNAIPPEQALALARAADDAVAAEASLGPLHGLPIAVKDVMDVAGLPTTAGAVPHKDRIATRDSLLAERLRAAGALIIGKTNTPEHGLGTLTFNDLFGPTRNPYALDRRAGGSSGGAAAAVAAGLLPLADGSDSGGSLRYPAAFCNVVGLRPSPGRIPPAAPTTAGARTACSARSRATSRDAGLLLSAIAGRDDRTPIALDDDPAAFASAMPSDLRGLRVAWSWDLDGLPIEAEVQRVLGELRTALVDAGCVVEDVEPDLSGADEAWETIEMLGFLAFCGADVARFGDAMRDDIVRNVEQGRALTAQQLVDAQATRTAIYRRTCTLMERYDLLAAPVAPVVPPPLEVPWVSEVAGTTFERYFEWQRCATRIVATAHPALSLPGGFSRDGPAGRRPADRPPPRRARAAAPRGRDRGGDGTRPETAAGAGCCDGRAAKCGTRAGSCGGRAAKCGTRAANCDGRAVERGDRAVIETVLGPLDPALLGATSMHEHLLFDARALGLAPPREHFQDDAGLVATELADARRAGLSAVVDLTVWGFGGPSPRLPQLARDSGVHVIAGVGAYLGRTWPEWLRELDGDALTARFVAALSDRLPGCDHRAGIVGLVGEGIPPAPEEERAVRAAGAAAAATGAAVALRLDPRADAAPRLLELLRREGVGPERVLLSNVDGYAQDHARVRDLAATGATLKWCFGYDAPPRAGLTAATDAQRIDAICMLVEHDPAARQTLACGTWTRSALRAHGGRGFAHLPQRIVPALRERGVGAAELDELLVAAPRRLLDIDRAARDAATPPR